jgi:hypothetical protein
VVQVIFVMEDVDAASNIVHARKPAVQTTVRITKETSIGVGSGGADGTGLEGGASLHALARDPSGGDSGENTPHDALEGSRMLNAMCCDAAGGKLVLKKETTVGIAPVTEQDDALEESGPGKELGGTDDLDAELIKQLLKGDGKEKKSRWATLSSHQARAQ